MNALDTEVSERRPSSGSKKGIGGRKPKYDWLQIDIEFGLSFIVDGYPPDYNINELVRRVWKRLEDKYGYEPDEMPGETAMKQRAAAWMRAVREENEAVGN